MEERSGAKHILINLRDTHDEPGRGIMCGPRDDTQAIQNCAGVIPFFSANLETISTKAAFFFAVFR